MILILHVISKDNKTKETNTAIFKSCCKKLKFLEIIVFFYFYIYSRTIIQFKFNFIPILTLIYAFFSIVLLVLYLYILYQKFENSDTLLGMMVYNIILWFMDFLKFVIDINNDFKRKNEFMVNFGYDLIIGEISVWILIICLFMHLINIRKGQICQYKED